MQAMSKGLTLAALAITAGLLQAPPPVRNPAW